jgi:pimeloyl-ACP methyl ester carboxylesterase
VDLVASARQLADAVDVASEARERLTGDPRIDLVAHSMGTLVARWYLMYGRADLRPDGTPPPLTWIGAQNVRSAVMVAPPSAGSPLILQSMVDGEKVSSFLPRYPAGLVGTFPGMYTMLPRLRHGAVVLPDGTYLDTLDLETWDRFNWGLLSPQADEALEAMLGIPDRAGRRAAAKVWLGKMLDRARGLQAALDRPSERPEGFDLHVFLGDSRATPSVLEVDPATGELSLRASEPGDGRVTRRSAVLDERTAQHEGRALVSPVPWTSVRPTGGEHFAIIRDTVFLDNLLYLLLEDPGR